MTEAPQAPPKAPEPPVVSEEEYFNQRLIDQMDWFDRKSSVQQRKFYTLRTVEIVIGAMIPFLLTFDGITFRLSPTNSVDVINIVVGAMGVAIVVIGGMLSLHKYEQNYLNYRKYAELLKVEKWRYQTKVAPYNTANRFKTFVVNVERLLSEEQQAWQQYQEQKDEGDQATQSKIDEATTQAQAVKVVTATPETPPAPAAAATSSQPPTSPTDEDEEEAVG